MTANDDSVIYRVAGVSLDGGVQTCSASSAASATNRFDALVASGVMLAVYLVVRGADGRLWETKVVRAWARPAGGEEASEWVEGTGVIG